MRYFSPSTGFFYDDGIHKALPDDAVEITDDRHKQLLDDQSIGKMIIAGDDGLPIAVERPVVYPSVSQLKAMIDTRAGDIYSLWARFAFEYRERELAASVFVASGYKGDPGPWVTSYASAAGVSNDVAADRIMGQAGKTREAQAAIAVLRMRKYELDGLDGKSAFDLAEEISAAMNEAAEPVIGSTNTTPS